MVVIQNVRKYQYNVDNKAFMLAAGNDIKVVMVLRLSMPIGNIIIFSKKVAHHANLFSIQTKSKIMPQT